MSDSIRIAVSFFAAKKFTIFFLLLVGLRFVPEDGGITVL
jgi:hypothetical protein